MDLKEAYETLQKECGIEVGDTVRVLRKAKDYEMGWRVCWSREMDSFVGKTCKVKKISNCGIGLENCFNYPFYVLELVKKAEKKIDVKFFYDGKDVTDELSEESKRNLAKTL